MTSRELVRRTLEFDKPARIPRQVWTLPWARDRFPEALARLRRDFPDDIAGAPASLRRKPATRGEQCAAGIYVDEWGCTFENIEAGHIGEVKAPLIADWADLDRLRPPEEELTVDVDQVNAFCRGSDKFVTAACCPRPFERVQFLRRSDNLYLDLAERRGELDELLRRVHDFYLRQFDLWAGTDVDGLIFMDDWGAQRALLISPALWRDLFKPLYRDYINVAKAHGKYIFMHSDGYITDIIPDLIDLGLDAFNSQIFCMGVESLGKRFRGRLTFWGEIDRQHILPHATRDEVVAAVRLVKDSLYADGGVIAQCEFGPGGNPENVLTVFETWDALSNEL